MDDINEVFSGETLKAADLQGHEPVVTIESVEPVEFKNNNGKPDMKLLIKFVGKQKAFVSNKTNSRRIAMLHGTKFRQWVGKKIQLYADIVDFQGEPKEAIRVRPVKAPIMTPPDAPFNDPVDDIGETF